ncbi:MAG: hypothetical protein KDA91_10590 [Planctomycetaceae bacterium]|nr:hypothetical protein [Planctomycetaceae bacterium]
MSRIAMFCCGLFLACSMSGCCLLHGMGGGYPGYYGGGYGGGCGGCSTGACGAYAPGGYPSAGIYGAGPATAYAQPTTAYHPYAQTAMLPVDPLATY